MTDDEQKDEQDDEAEETYEKPEVEDLDTGSEPAVTAAGADSIVG